VATLVEADYLFLMTDVDALYTSNPKVIRGVSGVRHPHVP
jgi:glutamate 5-kinase